MTSDSATPTTRVVAAVITRDQKYLVCQRPAHKRHGGLWEFPGGKIEPGETDADALERELREELGVEVSEVGSPLFTRRDPGSPFVVTFIAVGITGFPHALEHDALLWATPSELALIALAPSDAAFVVHMVNTRA